MNERNDIEEQQLEEERSKLLQRVQDWLDVPMLVLAFVWLALLIGEFVLGESTPFYVLGTVIWIIFILGFLVEFSLAPRKIAYVKKNWLVVLSLILPALRIFRIFYAVRLLRLASVGRSVRLVRVVTSLNRGMGALGASLGRRGFGYVVVLTVLVVFAGAAGIFAFERNIDGGPQSYGEALWWTAMVVMTMGSQYWPETTEGRILCLILSIYALGVFGYLTAALATFFVGRDAENEEAELAGATALEDLRKEVLALREDLRTLPPQSPPDAHLSRGDAS
jgi:voltage-gated potassium channel